MYDARRCCLLRFLDAASCIAIIYLVPAFTPFWFSGSVQDVWWVDTSIREVLDLGKTVVYKMPK